MSPFVVINVGNSGYTLAIYIGPPSSVELPHPIRVAKFSLFQLEQLILLSRSWFAEYDGSLDWIFGGVQRMGIEQLFQQLLTFVPPTRCVPLDRNLLRLPTRVRNPEGVGLDRLAAAVAVNRLRTPNSAAIIVDCGTAVTVDVVSADGYFEGGTIFPGRQLALDALARGTSLLPQLAIQETIEPIGRDTQSAMQTGTLLASAGAVQYIVHHFQRWNQTACQIFATGGGWPVLESLLDFSAHHEPHLVLNGMAWARHLAQSVSHE